MRTSHIPRISLSLRAAYCDIQKKIFMTHHHYCGASILITFMASIKNERPQNRPAACVTNTSLYHHFHIFNADVNRVKI